MSGWSFAITVEAKLPRKRGIVAASSFMMLSLKLEIVFTMIEFYENICVGNFNFRMGDFFWNHRRIHFVRCKFSLFGFLLFVLRDHDSVPVTNYHKEMSLLPFLLRAVVDFLKIYSYITLSSKTIGDVVILSRNDWSLIASIRNHVAVLESCFIFAVLSYRSY